MILIVILLGLCIGSFVNALVWRLHQQEQARTKKEKAQYPIVRGRSMCPVCKHELAWYDLIPVLSWLSLGGKCRYCHKPISWQYPLVECATALLFAMSYLLFPLPHTTYYPLQLSLWLSFITGFMALIVYDVRWMLLPDRIVRPLQALAVLFVLINFFTSNTSSLNMLVSTLLSVLCSAGLFYALYQVSRGNWIGGGDVKLAVVLGLVLGSPAKALMMIFVASMLGSIVGLPLLVSKQAKQTTRIPFGPFLIVATILVFLFGTSLLTWYQRQLGL